MADINRRLLVGGGLGLLGLGLVFWGFRALTAFPPDTEPQGAYLRIAFHLGRGEVKPCFAYLEDRAQHSAYTLRDYRKKASERIAAVYPEPERTRFLDAYKVYAEAPDGADIWLEMANKKGWAARLRKDLSGIAKVEITGERATIETARGTRYPFRRRENGIWGLSLFTGELEAEAEKAARDWEVVEKAALDYERAK